MKKYYYILKMGVLNSIEYRFNFFVNLLNVFIPVIVGFFVWKSIYSGSISEIINGYRFHELVIYILVASIVSQIVSTGFEDQMSTEIRRGELDKYICKPFSYYLYKLCFFIGDKLIKLLVGVPILLVVYIIYSYVFSENIQCYNILLFLSSVCISGLINYAIFFSVACIGFWSSETWGIILAFRIVINILSGGVLPLDLLGEIVNKLSYLLPFRYTIQFPSEILLNKYSVKEILTGLIIQVIFLGVTWLIAHVMWQSGNKKYMAFGG